MDKFRSSDDKLSMDKLCPPVSDFVLSSNLVVSNAEDVQDGLVKPSIFWMQLVCSIAA